MAVALSKPRNKTVVMKKILTALSNNCAGHFKKRLWLSTEDAPSGTAPTGMATGDFIYHVPSTDVYVYEGSTTYTNITG
jgi:hypothetical protein